MKTIEEIRHILTEHRDELREYCRIRGIRVFGSYARGEQQETSDLDVLVEFEEPVSILGLAKAENYLSDLTGLKVDLIPRKDIRPELKDRILAEAVTI